MPSVRELAEMQLHREWVLEGGYSSLLAAPAYHSARIWGPIIQTVKAAVVAIANHLGIEIRESGKAADKPVAPIAPLPKPPNMKDDHPLVVSGRYK